MSTDVFILDDDVLLVGSVLVLLVVLYDLHVVLLLLLLGVRPSLVLNIDFICKNLRTRNFVLQFIH